DVPVRDGTFRAELDRADLCATGRGGRRTVKPAHVPRVPAVEQAQLVLVVAGAKFGVMGLVSVGLDTQQLGVPPLRPRQIVRVEPNGGESSQHQTLPASLLLSATVTDETQSSDRPANTLVEPQELASPGRSQWRPCPAWRRTRSSS